MTIVKNKDVEHFKHYDRVKDYVIFIFLNDSANCINIDAPVLWSEKNTNFNKGTWTKIIKTVYYIIIYYVINYYVGCISHPYVRTPLWIVLGTCMYTLII